MSTTMIRVLIGQQKYMVTSAQGKGSSDIVKEKEYQTTYFKGIELPKIGGVVEDNIRSILGHVYEEDKYHYLGDRKREHMIYDWTDMDRMKPTPEEIEKYAIKEPVLK